MAHTYSNVWIHAVFSTKERRPFLDDEIKVRLFPYLGGIIRSLGGNVLAINGPKDHIHLLFVLPPTEALADTIRKLKAQSTKWVRETWPTHAEFAWQSGYSAFSVSASVVPEVKAYIDRQEEHHLKRSFKEEIELFLRKHGIEYDQRFVVD